MVTCNRERIKEIKSEIEIDSHIDHCPKHHEDCCQNILNNPDMTDFRTKMDNLSFNLESNSDSLSKNSKK